MTTRADLRTDLRFRLNEAAADVWSDDELSSYLDMGIRGLYPYFWQYRVATSTAGAGPVQPAPNGCKNIYQIGQVREGATRVRAVRGWTEGRSNAIVPRLNIDGTTLVWSWTMGFDSPPEDDSDLDIPLESHEVVVVRAQLTALERVITDRTKAEKYFAVQVRQGVTEQDILDAIDALHQTLKEHLARAKALPEKVG